MADGTYEVSPQLRSLIANMNLKRLRQLNTPSETAAK